LGVDSTPVPLSKMYFFVIEKGVIEGEKECPETKDFIDTHLHFS